MAFGHAALPDNRLADGATAVEIAASLRRAESPALTHPPIHIGASEPCCRGLKLAQSRPLRSLCMGRAAKSRESNRSATGAHRAGNAPRTNSAEAASAEKIGDGPGDQRLVESLLAGEAMREACLSVLRQRMNDETIDLVAPASRGVRGVEVSHQGHRYGSLTSEHTTLESLAPHAAWIAAWLALEARLQRAHRDADIDPLTGAWNRRYCERFLAEAIDEARARRQTVTLLYFDVDDLKRFNDVFGHDAGDEILRETVRLLQSVIRPSDRVCRVGGDEFVVIFHEPGGPRAPGSKPPESIASIAARFQEQIRAHRFPKLAEGAPGRLTISGGLATFPWDGRTPEDLIRVADQLTIQSKRRGKNVIIIGEGTARATKSGAKR